MSRRTFAALLIAVVLLPSALAPAAPWRDDFDNDDQLTFRANVDVNGVDVRLAAASAIAARQGLVFPRGTGFDASYVVPWSVLREGSAYTMWYHGCSGLICQVGHAISPDGRNWTRQGPVLAPSLPEESNVLAYGDVIRIGAQYWMWYSGYDGSVYRILAANSTDGFAWTKRGVVLAPGAPDDRWVWRPTVVFSAGTFRMWYSADTAANPGWNAIHAATSADGLNWTKLGVVVPRGPAGTPDANDAQMPSVRVLGSRYEMVYTGHDGTYDRLLAADSDDGVAWTKRGVLVDAQGPGEGTRVLHPALLFEADRTWSVYYAAGTPSWQGFLATRAARTGWLRSVAVEPPSGSGWGWFNQTVSAPANTAARVSVRDASTLAALPNLENVTAGAVDLRAVDVAARPRLVLEAWLTSDDGATPVLDAWEVSWSEAPPPSGTPGFPWWWILVALGAIAVLIAVPIALVLRRRRRPSPPPVPPAA